MKLVDNVKKWAWQILAIVFFFLFLGKGCTSKKVSKINNNVDDVHVAIDSLNSEINSLKEKTFTKKELKDEMERVMLNYLIYEDDLDRGKTSLSQIKNKIESND